uniref:Uncharacterized protein n=1 Tax=Aegilops tauschii subsp. strangulata TaxID=200361 RepID=A0A453GS44_AEGTS
MERFCFLVILALSGLAMALQLTTLCYAAQAQPQPIYDIDGDELTGNNTYTIMAADRNLSNHCVSVGSFRREECHKHATLTPCKQFGETRGVHVSIKPAEASDGSGKEASIRLSTDVVVEFKGVVTWCKHHLQWYVHGEITNQTHVTASCFRGMKGCQPFGRHMQGTEFPVPHREARECIQANVVLPCAVSRSRVVRIRRPKVADRRERWA